MTKHSRLIAAILTLLFVLSACTALTVYAEPDGGSDGPGISSGDGQQGGNDGGSDSGNDGGSDSGNDHQQGDDSYNDGGNSGGNSYDDDDDDSGYNNQNQNNRNSYSDYDEEYDYEGERSSTGEILYVGGDQTYVPPATIPSTTAALYDTSKVKVDESTLTKSDWADIKQKLTASANTDNNPDTGDFAFIQKNTSVEDNGHWMLYLGFALIGLGVIGIIFLIIKASERRKQMAAATVRTVNTERPAPPAVPQQSAPAKKSGKRNLRYRDDSEYGDDYGAKPKGGTRFSK